MGEPQPGYEYLFSSPVDEIEAERGISCCSLVDYNYNYNAWTTQMVQVHTRHALDKVEGSTTGLNQTTDYVCVLFV